MQDAQLFVFCPIANAPKHSLQTFNPSQRFPTRLGSEAKEQLLLK